MSCHHPSLLIQAFLHPKIAHHYTVRFDPVVGFLLIRIEFDVPHLLAVRWRHELIGGHAQPPSADHKAIVNRDGRGGPLAICREHRMIAGEQEIPSVGYNAVQESFLQVAPAVSKVPFHRIGRWREILDA